MKVDRRDKQTREGGIGIENEGTQQTKTRLENKRIDKANARRHFQWNALLRPE